jgi:RTX calcium-binding nonapeptide repeat (4 copies)
MARIWDIKHGRPDFDFLQTMQDALYNGSVLNPVHDPAKVVVGNGGLKVVIFGSFTYGTDPGPDSGTVTGLRVVDHGTKLAAASGYHLDVGDLGDAFDTLNSTHDFSGFMDLFFNTSVPSGSVRITMNGSDDRDVFKAPGDVPFNFYGNGGRDKFLGSASDDKIHGGDGKDVLMGRGDRDLIKGDNGSDRIDGGADNDHLVGGHGNDKFIFDTALGNGFMQAGVDTIQDFKPGQDIIKLDTAVFSSIGNFLSASEFHRGGHAGDLNDFILYKQSTGALYYDPDGSHSMPRIEFAVLHNTPDLSAADFLMM